MDADKISNKMFAKSSNEIQYEFMFYKQGQDDIENTRVDTYTNRFHKNIDIHLQ
jgi:hypothetical protein